MSNIPVEYRDSNDFGFTAVDLPSAPEAPRVETPPEVESELKSAHSKLDTIIEMLTDHPKLSKEEVDERLLEIEKMIMPLLVNLSKNPEKDYILWPNRKPQIDAFVERVLQLTRG